MIFKFIATKAGGHYHVKVFSAPARNQTFAKLGDLVMDERDYQALKNGDYEIEFVNWSGETLDNDPKPFLDIRTDT